MRLTNSLRNDFWDHVLTCNLSSCQIKFTIFIYNTTFECDQNNVYIGNLSAMARGYGYDRSYFYTEVRKLIDMCIIEKSKKFYKINIDYKIWDICPNLFRTIKKFNGAFIHKQLQRK